ncbi:MAG: glycerol ethanol, ferric requiring protein [Sclerophora amabilis]|nr:MAG: glycerol ethanol, ferric requiring protein [Sclerophora amabilis]
MNSRSTSFSALSQRRSSRPSFSSRVSFAVSIAEDGEAAGEAEHQIDEEIEEIKRYEVTARISKWTWNTKLKVRRPGLHNDRYLPQPIRPAWTGSQELTTIADWVQDAAREEIRRKARRRENDGFFLREGGRGWRRKLWESYDAGQAWIVVTLIGKEAIASMLEEVIFAFTAARLVKSFAPYAAGSGISEIKCIIAGFVMKGFLGFWTLLIKSIALPLAISSGLSVGKEGPSVHYAVCTGNVISRFFDKYKRNAAKTREILSACAAAGVAVAFGSPIGGVLFSLEEMSSYFPLKTMWRSYFCALVATAVLAAMNPFRTGQLVMFQVTYDRSWHFFEIIFYILIGIFGGLYGAFVMKWNLRAQAFRKRYLAKFTIIEATLLAAATAVVCYPNMFLRIDMTESMEILFLECEGGHDYNGICDAKNRSSMVLSLAIATILRTFLVIISYGCKVPAGIFVPSMAIGATFGRMVGILVQALHESYPKSAFFAGCEPEGPCITPGTYAFLGAGAALSGIMHITVSVVVIMFELTGALTYILPTMIVVGVTKAVGDRFGKGGIADRMIWFNGFPFLDNKEEHTFGVPVSRAMTSELTLLPASGLDLESIEKLLDKSKYQGFPVVEDRNSKVLVGYLGRTELRYAIDRAKREQAIISPHARCFFTPPASNPASTPSAAAPPVTFDTMASTSGQTSIDFSRFVNPTPIVVHPRLPLETVMEFFKKMGPRVILIEHRGHLTGLVTVKDCLKYQFKVEASESARDDTAVNEGQERLWELMQKAAWWFADKASIISRRGPRFSRAGFERLSQGTSSTLSSPTVPRRPSASQPEGSPTVEGTRSDEHDDVELEDR